jgi:SsrA-binding protein
MKKSPTQSIVNRRARYDYELGEDLVVGVVLTGKETKAARNHHVSLKGAYVTINGGELYLINAGFTVDGGVDTRTRKLLAHRRQIVRFVEDKKQGLTIVPTKLLTDGRHIKLVIASGRGKKRYDKRQAIKQRDLARHG